MFRANIKLSFESIVAVKIEDAAHFDWGKRFR